VTRRWPTRSRPTAHVRFLAGARTLVDGIPFGRAQKVGRKGRRDALRVRRGQDPLWRLNHRAGHGHLKTASCARATNAVVLPRTICSVVFLYSSPAPRPAAWGPSWISNRARGAGSSGALTDAFRRYLLPPDPKHPKHRNGHAAFGPALVHCPGARLCGLASRSSP